MGQGLSCGEPHEHGLFRAVQNGEIEAVEAMVDEEPRVLEKTTASNGRLSALHLAAANGQIQVGSLHFWCLIGLHGLIWDFRKWFFFFWVCVVGWGFVFGAWFH